MRRRVEHIECPYCGRVVTVNSRDVMEKYKCYYGPYGVSGPEPYD